MTAIGFAVAWAGYAIAIWGYCLVRDYDVTLPQLFKAAWPGAGTTTAAAAAPKAA